MWERNFFCFGVLVFYSILSLKGFKRANCVVDLYVFLFFFLSKIMTFVWHVDCDVHDTFERDAVIRLRSEVDKSLNYAVATVALAHNLGFEYPVDPYRCRSIHGPVKAVMNQIEKKTTKSINQTSEKKHRCVCVFVSSMKQLTYCNLIVRFNYLAVMSCSA